MKFLLDPLVQKKYPEIVSDSGYLIKISTPKFSYIFNNNQIINETIHFHEYCNKECTLSEKLFEDMVSISLDKIYSKNTFDIKLPDKYFNFIKAKINQKK